MPVTKAREGEAVNRGEPWPVVERTAAESPGGAPVTQGKPMPP